MNNVFVDKIENTIAHIGTKYHSGRYPYGSGEHPYQHANDFMSRVTELEKEGISYIDKKTGKKITGQKAIANALGIKGKDGEPSIKRLRIQMSLATNDMRRDYVDKVRRMRDKEGMRWAEIGRVLGKNESTIRSLYDERSKRKMDEAITTADVLKKKVDEEGILEVGKGVERQIGVSRDRMEQALYILEMQGYPTYGGGMDQITNPGRRTNSKYLCPPGTEHKEIYNLENIHYLDDIHSEDGGKTFKPKFEYPASLDSKRLEIKYAEDGGKDRDGLIELRRGVEDISLGESHYAQVRILVDGTHYLKGMAVYSDDLPDGVDVRFNTNKTKDKTMHEVLKPIKTSDPNNPFGSAIGANGQRHWTDEKGVEHLGLINKRADEGDWEDWKKTLPSQFLAKQSKQLATNQLNLDLAGKKEEFETINALTNNTVKKSLLLDFADGCDSAAVHLKAAALPRQRYQVLLPDPDIPEGQVYAPNYREGEKVALVRYPHGGTFEIPILTVNNKIKSAQEMMSKNPIDAIAINSKTAARLSGADFDGDAVTVIPCNSRGNRVQIKSTDELKGLEGFDPQMEYAGYPGMKTMQHRGTQIEMGRITNLITDMTIKRAPEEDLAMAVRHSMVVIDAEKHKLDYRRSEKENQIARLKKTYQGYINEEGKNKTGASTLISRAKNPVKVIKRQGSPRIDPDTGRLVYKEVDNPTWTDRYGHTHTRTQDSKQMAEAIDARTLSSGSPIEEVYANYANSMKALANTARKTYLSTPNQEYSPAAKINYKPEYDSLMAKLRLSEANAPRERRAQALAHIEVKGIKEDNPDLSGEDIKKINQMALERARDKIGAERKSIELTDREWEAIQAGAISHNKLTQIMKYADMDVLKEKAMPRTNKKELTPAKKSRIKRLKMSGYTNEQIAEQFGVSISTISKVLSSKA